MSQEHLHLKQYKSGRMIWTTKFYFLMDLQFLLYFWQTRFFFFLLWTIFGTCTLNSNKSSLKIPIDWHNYHLLDGGAQLTFHYGFCNAIFFSCFPANVSLLSVIVRSFWFLRLIFYVTFMFVCLFDSVIKQGKDLSIMQVKWMSIVLTKVLSTGLKHQLKRTSTFLRLQNTLSKRYTWKIILKLIW